MRFTLAAVLSVTSLVTTGASVAKDGDITQQDGGGLRATHQHAELDLISENEDNAFWARLLQGSLTPPQAPSSAPTIEDQTTRSCIDSGGNVTTAFCCESVESFPNTCVIGACGCSPANSKEIQVCSCPVDLCFDGTECTRRDAPVPETPSPTSEPTPELKTQAPTSVLTSAPVSTTAPVPAPTSQTPTSAPQQTPAPTASPIAPTRTPINPGGGTGIFQVSWQSVVSGCDQPITAMTASCEEGGTIYFPTVGGVENPVNSQCTIIPPDTLECLADDPMESAGVLFGCIRNPAAKIELPATTVTGCSNVIAENNGVRSYGGNGLQLTSLLIGCFVKNELEFRAWDSCLDPSQLDASAEAPFCVDSNSCQTSCCIDGSCEDLGTEFLPDCPVECTFDLDPVRISADPSEFGPACLGLIST